MLVFWFAYPMPFFLRWGLKGLGFAYCPLIVLFLPGIAADLHHFVDHLLDYPIRMALALPGLFALSYLLSLKAFAGRDF